MILTVDGHDLRRFIIAGQYDVERNDLEGPTTGRTLDTVLWRDYLGWKLKVSVRMIPLTIEEWGYIEHDVLRGKKEVSVTFEDFGRIATERMYSSSFRGTISTVTGKRIGAATNFIQF